MKKDKGPAVNYADYSETPELFVEGFQGVTLRNGVVKLNLFTKKLDFNTKTELNKGVATLVVPVPDLVSIATVLNTMIADFQAQGVIQKVEVAKEEPSRAGTKKVSTKKAKQVH